MMRWMWAALCLLFLPCGAQAQVVTLRAGEHAGFVRLALTFSTPVGWDFGRSDTGYVFRSRQSGVSYDISQVFQPIARNRLADVQAEGSDLFFVLSCHCHAIATNFRPGIVVVDILDGPPPAGSPYEGSLSQKPSTIWQSGGRRPRPRPYDFRPLLQASAVSWYSVQEQQPSLMPLPRSPLPEVEHMIGEMVETAVDQGLLQPVGKPVLLPTADPKVYPLPQVQLRLVDPKRSAEPIQAMDELNCLAPELLELEKSYPESDPLKVLARQRFDISLAEGPDMGRLALLHAKTLISLGMGVEAGEVLRLWGPGGPELLPLQAMARLLESERVEPYFAGMQHCAGPVALWSLLGQPHKAVESALDRDAVLQAFSKLPKPLRYRLGERLIDRFLDIPDLEGAQRLRNVMGRGAEAQSALHLAEGKIAVAEHRPQEAVENFSAVVEQDRHRAPQALIQLVEAQVAQGLPPSEESLKILEAMVAEYRHTDLAPSLRSALAKGYVLHHQGARALALVPENSNKLWPLLIDHANDAALAEAAYYVQQDSRPILPQGVLTKLVDRLLGMGFADAAEIWISGLADEDRVLRQARAHLVRGDGRSALRTIAQITGPEAEELRAKALDKLGLHRLAGPAWMAAQQGAAAERSQLLSRDWAGLALTSPAPLAEVVELLSGTPEASSADLGSLRALLSRSQSTREAVGALLTPFSP